MSWASDSGASSYSLYQSTDDTTWGSPIYTGSGTSYPSTGLLSSQKYYYQLSASNTYGTSSYTTASATTQASGTRSLLSASDFTYLGYYLLSDSVGDGIAFENAITHRYVGGQLRFLLMAYNSGSPKLVEFALPSSGGYGQTISSSTNSWSGSSIWPSWTSGWSHIGLYYEDLGSGAGRLWTTQGVDYPGTYSGLNYDDMTSAISVCGINSDNTLGSYNGLWGFQGVSQRCVMWKVAKNPSWVQSTYGLGPYLYGFGGYSSLASQGGLVSLGLFAISGPDITTYTPLPYTSWTSSNLNGTGADYTIPSSAFKIVADHRSGLADPDWYVSPGSPTSADRGIRNTSFQNFFDGGANYDIVGTVSVGVGSSTVTFGTAQNASFLVGYYIRFPGLDSSNGDYLIASSTSSTVFTISPSYGGTSAINNATGIIASTAQNGVISNAAIESWYSSHTALEPPGYWTSPAPDGKSRWAWGDTYGSSGSWVDGSNKYGFVTVGSFAGTWAGYVNSAFGSGSSEAEIHVFDPADFGAVIASTKNPWNVQPVAMKTITSDIVPQGGCLSGHQNAGSSSPGGATYDPVSGCLYVWVPGLSGGYTCGLFVYQVNS